ncbi:NAD-dependent epimerase [Endozoicomonas acroporae]|uniref:NAD-dependent epimerase n=1 Tax=Endozoicomonas acroporae TaxID=1701104 RepID=UPI003D7A5759
MKYLVTGTAGFIGFYVARKLCELGHEVVGLDNLNSYYIQKLKHDRLEQLKSYSNLQFVQMDLADRADIAQLFQTEKFQRVIHLAAQAGVRYSLENPMAYIDSNLVGMATILEGCRHNEVEHLVYASSSSVYGMNSKMPYSTKDAVDHPVSLYAATKKANELLAHSYSHLYKLPTTGLRFFTVNGPWGRPDMAAWKFTQAILEGKPINVFNHGELQRDFTDIEDILEGIIRIQDVIPKGKEGFSNDDPGRSSAPYRVYNIGNNQPVKLMDFINAIEKACGKEALKNYLPMQAGDVYATYADVDDLMKDVGFKPKIKIDETMNRFVGWYRNWC